MQEKVPSLLLLDLVPARFEAVHLANFPPLNQPILRLLFFFEDLGLRSSF